MSRLSFSWVIFLCLFVELQGVISKASLKGNKTRKATGKIQNNHSDETRKEKRFMINTIPRRRVVYSFVTDRNRYVPRRPRLYRAYIVKRPLIVRQPSVENAEGRQSIPYVQAQPTFSPAQLPSAHTITAQPLFYYQDTSEHEPGLSEFDEPFEEEAFPEVPQEFSGNLLKYYNE